MGVSLKARGMGTKLWDVCVWDEENNDHLESGPTKIELWINIAMQNQLIHIKVCYVHTTQVEIAVVPSNLQGTLHVID